MHHESPTYFKVVDLVLLLHCLLSAGRTLSTVLLYMHDGQCIRILRVRVLSDCVAILNHILVRCAFLIPETPVLKG